MIYGPFAKSINSASKATAPCGLRQRGSPYIIMKSMAQAVVIDLQQRATLAKIAVHNRP